MAASFPTSIKSFTTKVDLVDSVLAADTNEQSDEITAIETYLINSIALANWTPTRAVSGGTTPTYTFIDTSRYLRTGKLVECWITWINTSGGTAGAGSSPVTFTLPVAANGVYSLTNSVLGYGYVYESGGTDSNIFVTLNSTTLGQFVKVAGLGNVTGNDQNTTDRRISAHFCYEAA